MVGRTDFQEERHFLTREQKVKAWFALSSLKQAIDFLPDAVDDIAKMKQEMLVLYRDLETIYNENDMVAFSVEGFKPSESYIGEETMVSEGARG